MELDSNLEAMWPVVEMYFPELFSSTEASEPTPDDVTQTLKLLFSQKVDNDLEDLLMCPEIKFADTDSALTLLKRQVECRAVLDLRELLFYKVLQCPCTINCVNRPPEIVPHNEYMDQYLLCPFYHHEKDRRRLVVSANSTEDFTYKANYQKIIESLTDTDIYSRNFFESLFHPIFYKLFVCKRKYCNGSYLCPFRHSEKEKTQWDERFYRLTKKHRDIFLKEKSYMGSYQYIGSITSINSNTSDGRGSLDDL